jgi:hypothetical protein
MAVGLTGRKILVFAKVRNDLALGCLLRGHLLNLTRS